MRMIDSVIPSLSAPAKKREDGNTTSSTIQHLATESKQGVNSIYTDQLINSIATIVKKKALEALNNGIFDEPDCNSLRILQEAEKLTNERMFQIVRQHNNGGLLN